LASYREKKIFCINYKKKKIINNSILWVTNSYISGEIQMFRKDTSLPSSRIKNKSRKKTVEAGAKLSSSTLKIEIL
jgi:hypothetical protein